jgi:DUF1365 family protein
VVSASCLYEGTIRHRRLAVREREFSYGLTLAYIDLDELPTLLGGRLVAQRPGLVRFRRRDYLGDPTLSLTEAVRERAFELTGERPAGPIRVLTQLRTLGHCFNPVSFYMCLDPSGQRLETVLAEVTNTPWGERRAYALRADGDSGLVRGSFAKSLHVSPFMGMDQRYEARMSAPGPTLSVHIANHEGEALQFDATLSLRRRELSRRTLAGMLSRYPLPTLRVLALIYAYAARLALRRVPIHPHPEELSHDRVRSHRPGDRARPLEAHRGRHTGAR